METWIFKPTDYFRRLDWREVFSRPVPVEIDLGCGKGGFLVWSAQQRLDHEFLGVERQMVRLRKVESKLRRASVTNARLIRIESGYLVTWMIPDNSVTAYHILFPDPWPKRHHAGHRLFQPEFVTELARTLTTTGYVHFATDDHDYFQQASKLMEKSGQFTGEIPEDLPVEAQTEFEKVFREQGKPIYRVRWCLK